MNAESSQYEVGFTDMRLDMKGAGQRATLLASSSSVSTSTTAGEQLRGPRTGRLRAILARTDTHHAQKFGRIETSSALTADVLAVLRRLARTDVTLTLIGETGTGKDVTAHAVHEASARSSAPFVVFDCGAVPPNLVESELERGAFTGAHTEHEGAFERARGGTLFLDEIGELPLDPQPRLLRALDSRSIRRVGGSRDRTTDVRIVAATNRDLAAFVETKQFREDLYYRLAAAVVQLPPLRERLEDLRLLVPQLLADLGRGLVPSPTGRLSSSRRTTGRATCASSRTFSHTRSPSRTRACSSPRHCAFYLRPRPPPCSSACPSAASRWRLSRI
jgi:transcriptional regulator with PAS, ATPase and Fis domain